MDSRAYLGIKLQSGLAYFMTGFIRRTKYYSQRKKVLQNRRKEKQLPEGSRKELALGIDPL